MGIGSSRIGWLGTLPAFLSSCGAGSAAIVAGSDDASPRPPTVLSSFEVVSNPKVSPTRLRLVTSRALRVRLSYRVRGASGSEAPEESMRGLTGSGVDGSTVDLPDGEAFLLWDFVEDFGSDGFVQNVELFVRRLDGGPLTGGELALPGVGNHQPEIIRIVTPPEQDPSIEESSGIVPVGVQVSDSSSDVVSIDVEWRPLGSDWRPATSSSAFPHEDPFQGVEAPQGGISLTFHWNTDVDLFEGEDAVQLRFTPDDGTVDAQGTPVGRGTPVESAAFRIDNNAEPLVAIDTGFFLSNPDLRRGIPVPFRAQDAESDALDLVFQWRRPGEGYPPLPADPERLAEVLADPEQRRELRVASPHVRRASGRVAGADATRARLPELAAAESWAIARGLAGRELVIQRGSLDPVPVGPRWGSAALAIRGPVAALPVGDGLTAVVVDAPAGAPRLSLIELATGRLLRQLATLGAGEPSACALEVGENAVLVASDLGGTWRIERVDLASGLVSELCAADGSLPTGSVRSLASMGTQAALLLVGDALVHLGYREASAGRAEILLSGFDRPEGLALDPARPELVYLAESGRDRLLALDVDRHAQPIVVVGPSALSGLALSEPCSLALENGGARLLALVRGADGVSRQLVAVDLGRGNALHPIGTALPADATGLVVGAEGLRILVLPDRGELAIGGGIEQRRTIRAYDPRTSSVEVEVPFAPTPQVMSPWWIPLRDQGPWPSDAGGRPGAFLWDSSDLPQGGFVHFRAVPADSERGEAIESNVPRSFQAPQQAAPVRLPIELSLPVSVQALVAADADADGDLDLLLADFFDRLVLAEQTAPGVFPAFTELPGTENSLQDPKQVVAADLDSDGDVDMVTANSSNLTPFFQHAPGAYAAHPALDLPGSSSPESVDAADLDADGDLDLIASSVAEDALLVFSQTITGSFDLQASPILAGSLTNPQAVRAADLDADGAVDLVLADGGPVVIFLASAPGQFGASQILPSAAARFDSIAVADVDGDGFSDMVSTNPFRGRLELFLQRDSGEFDPVPATISDPSLSSSVFARDIDGDARRDLVAGHVGIRAFLQKTPPSFDPSPLTLSDRIGRFTLADLDGDGDSDLAQATITTSGSVSEPWIELTFQQRGETLANDPTLVAAPDTTLSSPFPVDFDGDGDLDLASIAGQAGIGLLRQSSPRTFDPSPQLLSDPAMVVPRDVAAADLDGDGGTDIVSLNAGQNLTVLFQSPGGVFGPAVIAGEGLPNPNGGSLTIADLDQDGDLDIAATRTGSNQSGARLHLQNEPRSFEETVNLRTGDGDPFSGPFIVGDVHATDLDLDGACDVFLTVDDSGFFSGQGGLRVYFQVAAEPGRFTPQPLRLGTALITGSGNSADLDGDGDQDLVLGVNTALSFFEGGYEVFTQTTPRTFTSALVGTHAEFGPDSVGIADLDQDGDPDLVSATSVSSSELWIFRQARPGVFQPAERLPQSAPRDALAADLDGDGDTDLLADDDGRFRIYWGGS